MRNLTLSDKYGIAASVALIVMVLINSAVVMLVLALAGIIAGMWVLRKGEARRVAFVSLAAFVIAAIFGAYALITAA